MKIQKVKFLNFRNVPNIEKELKGSNIILLAENTKGKSNFIKGLQAALAGTIGKEAIAHGHDKAEVEILMSDFEKDQPIPGTDYTFKMKVSKDKEGEEKVKLEVTAPNGMVDTKKTTIGSIAGEVELDFNFVELSKTVAGKKKQLEIVKSYLDEETKEGLRVWESKAKRAFDERTEVGREIKSKEGFLSSIGITEQDVQKFKEPIDVTELNQQVSSASTKNTEIKEVEARSLSRSERNAAIEKEVAELEAKIQALKTEWDQNQTKNDAAKRFLSENKPVSIEDIQNQLKEAGEHNYKHQKVKDYFRAKDELDQIKEQAGELTALIESSREAIATAIREMSFPIEGITFDEESVYYNGKIVDESTLSTAEIMMLEVEFKMCKAPNAEVVFIQRGESLGLEMLKQLQLRAKEKGYQLIMEQVERGTEELKIELMPDYTNEAVEA